MGQEKPERGLGKILECVRSEILFLKKSHLSPRARASKRLRVVPPCSLQVPRAVWCRRGLGGLGGGRGSGQGHGALGGLPEEGARLQLAAAEPRGPQAGWC